jgi:hypothetical protein
MIEDEFFLDMPGAVRKEKERPEGRSAGSCSI